MPFLRHSLRRGISQLGHSSVDIKWRIEDETYCGSPRVRLVGVKALWWAHSGFANRCSCGPFSGNSTFYKILITLPRTIRFGKLIGVDSVLVLDLPPLAERVESVWACATPKVKVSGGSFVKRHCACFAIKGSIQSPPARFLSDDQDFQRCSSSTCDLAFRSPDFPPGGSLPPVKAVSGLTVAFSRAGLKEQSVITLTRTYNQTAWVLSRLIFLF